MLGCYFRWIWVIEVSSNAKGTKRKKSSFRKAAGASDSSQQTQDAPRQKRVIPMI